MEKGLNVFRGRQYTCTVLFFLCLFCFLCEKNIRAITYGGSAANTTYYRSLPILLEDGDEVVGFAYLAGGFHTLSDDSITFSNVPAPIAKDIYLREGTVVNIEGDLTLSTSHIYASGDFAINGCGNTLFLNQNTTLPAGRTITLQSDLVIDGQGNVLTLASDTIFTLGGKTLTLRNMVIKNLTGTMQFYGTGSLVLQNCILDVSTGATSTLTVSTVTITDDVIIRGGGTFKLCNGDATPETTISPNSTLYIDLETTLEYAGLLNSYLTLSDATSSIHINGGTLKAIGSSGLMLNTGRLILENNVTFNNGGNTDIDSSIKLGDGSSDLTVKILSGAYITIDGFLYHNPS